jgi:hypothetical protein
VTWSSDRWVHALSVIGVTVAAGKGFAVLAGEVDEPAQETARHRSSSGQRAGSRPSGLDGVHRAGGRTVLECRAARVPSD